MSIKKLFYAVSSENTFHLLTPNNTEIITNENQQNAQIINIYFSICSTYMFRLCLTIIRVCSYRVSNTVICAFVQGVIVYKYILHNPYIVWYVDN
jgi:hypothetical protein